MRYPKDCSSLGINLKNKRALANSNVTITWLVWSLFSLGLARFLTICPLVSLSWAIKVPAAPRSSNSCCIIPRCQGAGKLLWIQGRYETRENQNYQSPKLQFNPFCLVAVGVPGKLGGSHRSGESGGTERAELKSGDPPSLSSRPDQRSEIKLDFGLCKQTTLVFRVTKFEGPSETQFAPSAFLLHSALVNIFYALHHWHSIGAQQCLFTFCIVDSLSMFSVVLVSALQVGSQWASYKETASQTEASRLQQEEKRGADSKGSF